MNWLSWKIACPATAFTQRSGPTGMPSPAASFSSCRASYASTQSAPSWAMKRCECGCQSRVRSPTAARRRGLPTGAARRRARVATLIGVSWPPGGEDSEARRLGVPVAASIARSWRPTWRRPATRHRGRRPRAHRTGRDRRPLVALGLVAVGAFALYALLSLAIHGPRVHPDEERYLIARVLARRGRGPHAPRAELRLRAAPRARARRDHPRRGQRRRRVRLVQGRERALLRADGGTRVPARPQVRLRLVGGARGGPGRRDPLVRLGRRP